MKSFTLLAVASLASAAAISSPTSKTSPVALYFMSNELHGNSIHALSVNKDGLVASQGSVTSTGGKGGRAPAAMLTDALNSQGSLAMAGNHLYAVNAGSNTISVLAIDPNNPMNVTLIGEPVPTYGDFPNSIALEPKLRLACVSNTGAKSGIACYNITKDGLLSHSENAFRPLTLSPKQRNPPTGPFNTVSEVFFNQEGTSLFATVKGAPNGSEGYFASFPVDKRSVSVQQVNSTPKGTLVLFGSVALPNDRVFYTDASFGAGFLQIESDGVATTLSKTPISGNSATCWAAYSEYTGLYYTTDDGADQVASFNATTGKLVQLNRLRNRIPQMIELISAGEKLYALSHGNSTFPQHLIVLEPNSKGFVHSKQTFALNNTNINIEGLVALMDLDQDHIDGGV